MTSGTQGEKTAPVGEVGSDRDRSEPIDDTIAPDELRESARRTLQFGRGVLRRRWAAYYAVWGLAVTCYFLLPVWLGGTSVPLLPPLEGTVLFVALLLGVTLGALTVSLVVYGLAERTFTLRLATYRSNPFRSRERAFRYAVVAALVLGVVFLSTRSGFAALLAVDTILVVLTLFLTRHLGRAFRPIPIEGWAAASSFFVAAAASCVSLLAFRSEAAHTWAWLGGILVWFGCAAYARFAPVGNEGAT